MRGGGGGDGAGVGAALGGAGGGVGGGAGGDAGADGGNEATVRSIGNGPTGPRNSAGSCSLVLAGGVIGAPAAGACVCAGAGSAAGGAGSSRGGVSETGCAAMGGVAINAAAAIAIGERRDFMAASDTLSVGR